MHWLYAGPSCTICQFWPCAGQCFQKYWYMTIFVGRLLICKVAICVGDEFD